MKRTRVNYSQSFKQQVLDDYFQTGMSQSACARKWKIHQTTVSDWLLACVNQKKQYLYALILTSICAHLRRCMRETIIL